MPKIELGLASLAIESLDHLNCLRDQQQILELVIELFDYPDEKNFVTRAGLLLNMYRASVDNQLDELRACLEQIRQLITGKEES